MGAVFHFVSGRHLNAVLIHARCRVHKTVDADSMAGRRLLLLWITVHHAQLNTPETAPTTDDSHDRIHDLIQTDIHLVQLMPTNFLVL